jgi:hypothetical protein
MATEYKVAADVSCVLVGTTLVWGNEISLSADVAAAAFNDQKNLSGEPG